MIEIRKYERADWAQLWPIVESEFRTGETYAFPIQTTEEEARAIWVDSPRETYVAADPRGKILGTYFVKANQPGQGGHVCNCGYIVAEQARGQGLATRLCVHSQRRAQVLGFLAMQYNLVVSTNTGAIRLWKKLGFEVVGRLPKAFNSPSYGLVDALVMYKELIGQNDG